MHRNLGEADTVLSWAIGQREQAANGEEQRDHTRNGPKYPRAKVATVSALVLLARPSLLSVRRVLTRSPAGSRKGSGVLQQVV
jgi:hypothetical protein